MKQSACDGIRLVPCILQPHVASRCKVQADGVYQKTVGARSSERSLEPLPLPERERFLPTASSFTIGAVFSAEELQTLLSGVVSETSGAWIRSMIPGRIACDLDQSWVRRQYAPSHYPAFHAPHGWHQDGALGFDFGTQAPSGVTPDAILRMVTCWIALDPCGKDAPGLELVDRQLENLLAPGQLTEKAVDARFGADQFWRPVLEAGDALLFCGDIMHRTYVTPAMTLDRTSIELRFFSADKQPERLKADRFVRLV